MTKILQMQSSLYKDNTHIAGHYENNDRGKKHARNYKGASCSKHVMATVTDAQPQLRSFNVNLETLEKSHLVSSCL
mgnify:CR=1 FL=1